MSAAVASSTATDGHRAIVVAALMASFMQAVAISLPNAALLYLQGTLSMADDEVGWVFTSYIAASVITMPMTRWLAGRYGRKTIYQLSIAIFALGLVLAARATTPMQFVAARIVQGGASGPLAPLSMAILLDILPPSQHARINLVVDRDPDGRHPQRSQHRRLAQRISRLALDVLSRSCQWRGSSSWRCRSRFRRSGPSRIPLRLLRLDDLLVRHHRVADAARPRRTPGVVQLGRDLGRGDRLGAGFLPLSRARPDHEGHFLDNALFRDRNFVLSAIMYFAFGFVLLPTIALTSPMLDECSTTRPTPPATWQFRAASRSWER